MKIPQTTTSVSRARGARWGSRQALLKDKAAKKHSSFSRLSRVGVCIPSSVQHGTMRSLARVNRHEHARHRSSAARPRLWPWRARPSPAGSGPGQELRHDRQPLVHYVWQAQAVEGVEDNHTSTAAERTLQTRGPTVSSRPMPPVTLYLQELSILMNLDVS